MIIKPNAAAITIDQSRKLAVTHVPITIDPWDIGSCWKHVPKLSDHLPGSLVEFQYLPWPGSPIKVSMYVRSEDIDSWANV